jgi:hypothetical protein
MHPQIREQTLLMLKDPSPELWPAFPLLPMVNRNTQPGAFPETAVVSAADTKKLLFVNLYDPEKVLSALLGENEAAKTFESHEAMVDEGWEVD